MLSIALASRPAARGVLPPSLGGASWGERLWMSEKLTDDKVALGPEWLRRGPRDVYAAWRIKPLILERISAISPSTCCYHDAQGCLRCPEKYTLYFEHMSAISPITHCYYMFSCCERPIRTIRRQCTRLTHVIYFFIPPIDVYGKSFFSAVRGVSQLNLLYSV